MLENILDLAKLSGNSYFGSTKTRNSEFGNGNGNGNGNGTEYGIRERRFQAMDLKKKNVSNDKKIKNI